VVIVAKCTYITVAKCRYRCVQRPMRARGRKEQGGAGGCNVLVGFVVYLCPVYVLVLGERVRDGLSALLCTQMPCTLGSAGPFRSVMHANAVHTGQCWAFPSNSVLLV